MSRKNIAYILSGFILGAVLNSGFFNEAEQAKQSKEAWLAVASK